MANLTLIRTDSYLAHLRPGNKPDILASLRTAPLHMVTLFHKNPQRSLHPPPPEPTKSDNVAEHHWLLCKSSHEQLPDGGITCTRNGQNLFGPKTHQLVEASPRPQHSEPIPQGSQDLPPPG